MKWVVYWTDACIFLLIVGLGIWIYLLRKTQEWHLIQNRIFEHPRYLVALMILVLYGTIGVLDSVHFREYNITHSVKSVLDVLLSPRDTETEITYSAPFSIYAYNPEVIKMPDGSFSQIFPQLKFAGQNLKESNKNKIGDIFIRICVGVAIGLLLTGLLYGFSTYRTFYSENMAKRKMPKAVFRTFWLTLTSMICIMSVIYLLMIEYHILGTDKIGRDVFYVAVKCIRTGLVIGTITTLVMLPFALLLGLWAGYFRGWLDDVVQYIYTTLSSIPGVLLIAAAMLSFQIKIEVDPDLRLLILCAILGVTSWTTLCRLLRAETLKLRELDFVQSAIVLGATPLNIIRRHIMPNLMHIVIITVVLDFSGLVLAEAVLSYVGVGVSPVSFSWGNMINASRLDMARDPIVWWSLCGALFLMFVLVFSANVFSDALQEALNPKAG